MSKYFKWKKKKKKNHNGDVHGPICCFDIPKDHSPMCVYFLPVVQDSDQ